MIHFKNTKNEVLIVRHGMSNISIIVNKAYYLLLLARLFSLAKQTKINFLF